MLVLKVYCISSMLSRVRCPPCCPASGVHRAVQSSILAQVHQLHERASSIPSCALCSVLRPCSQRLALCAVSYALCIIFWMLDRTLDAGQAAGEDAAGWTGITSLALHNMQDAAHDTTLDAGRWRNAGYQTGLRCPHRTPDGGCTGQCA